MRLLACCLRGFFTSDATKRGANGHPDPGGIALTQYIACHHFTGNEQVRAGGTCEMNRTVFIYFQPEIGKGDSWSQGITVVGGVSIGRAQCVFGGIRPCVAQLSSFV